MSNHYTVAWDATRHGTPKDFALAGEQAARLLLQEDSASENVQRFAEEVDAYLRGSGEEGWQQFLWDLPGRAKGSGRAAMRIEMPYEDWQHILVKMVEVAAKHQVVLYNENLVMVFLPSGKVLPTARNKVWEGLQAAWDADGEFPQTKGQFKKWFDPQFETVLARHGQFIKGKEPWGVQDPAYIRTIGQASQYVSYNFDGGGGIFDVEVSFAFSYEAVTEIARKFKFHAPYMVISGDILFDIMKVPLDKRNIRSIEESRAYLKTIDDVLGSAFDLAVDISGLDKLLNGEADTRYRDHFHNYVYMPQCLIVARLAGNQNFEELAIKLESTNGWYANGEVKDTEWPKLVEYLRNEVKPIV